MPADHGSERRLPAYLVDLCRQMRRDPTQPEAWLWSCLRNRQLDGRKFRRQRPLGRYIADFCCDGAKLAIELDGSVHARTVDYDTTRDAYLTAAGYRIIRIGNEEVEMNPEAVLNRIQVALAETPLA